MFFKILFLGLINLIVLKDHAVNSFWNRQFPSQMLHVILLQCIVELSVVFRTSNLTSLKITSYVYILGNVFENDFPNNSLQHIPHILIPKSSTSLHILTINFFVPNSRKIEYKYTWKKQIRKKIWKILIQFYYCIMNNLVK